MPLRALVTGLILVALAGCGKESMPDKPQLLLDRASIGFGQEFGSGTYIGTEPQESLLIENGGLQNLEISSVTIAGAAEFRITPPPKKTLKGKEHTFVQIFFKPTQVKAYSATLTIVSNAENTPSREVAVTGRGIAAPTDGG